MQKSIKECSLRERRREIIEYLQKYKIPLLSIPSITQLISGESTIDNLQPISIDDLLGREVKDPEGVPIFYIYDDGSVEKIINLK